MVVLVIELLLDTRDTGVRDDVDAIIECLLKCDFMGDSGDVGIPKSSESTVAEDTNESLLSACPRYLSLPIDPIEILERLPLSPPGTPTTSLTAAATLLTREYSLLSDSCSVEPPGGDASEKVVSPGACDDEACICSKSAGGGGEESSEYRV